MFKFENRRLFSELIFKEILEDFSYREIEVLIDFGCGDGYLLKLFREKYPSSHLLCIEKNLDIDSINKRENHYLINSYNEFRHEYTKFISKVDIIVAIDVIYLISKLELLELFEKFYSILKDNGVIYILLGIYSESKGLLVFDKTLSNIKESYNIDKFLSIKEFFSVFWQKGFNVFVKRLNINDIFGLKVDYNFRDNIKEYIDYLYQDKLLIKLTKEKPNQKISFENISNL